MRALTQDLVRHLGCNAHDISGGELSPDSALDCTVALFMRSHRLSVNQVAADQQGCRSRLHKEDINMGFMQFGWAIAFSVDQKGAVVGKIRKQASPRNDADR